MNCKKKKRWRPYDAWTPFWLTPCVGYCLFGNLHHSFACAWKSKDQRHIFVSWNCNSSPQKMVTNATNLDPIMTTSAMMLL